MASSAKQQKLDGFFIKKQTNNGINTDLTQTVPTISDTNEEGPNEEVENEKIMKSFQTKWLKEHHWLRYDPNTKETQVWQKFIKISTYYKQITTA